MLCTNGKEVFKRDSLSILSPFLSPFLPQRNSHNLYFHIRRTLLHIVYPPTNLKATPKLPTIHIFPFHSIWLPTSEFISCAVYMCWDIQYYCSTGFGLDGDPYTASMILCWMIVQLLALIELFLFTSQLKTREDTQIQTCNFFCHDSYVDSLLIHTWDINSRRR